MPDGVQAQQQQRTGSRILIRAATGYDASRIGRLLEEWFTTTKLHWPEPKSVDMTGWVLNTMANGHVFVAERSNEKSGRLIGCVGVTRSVLPWDNESVIWRDQFFYVPKAHREHGVANALLLRVKTVAARTQTPLLMGIISGYETDKLERWYALQGGGYVGGLMCFGIPQAEG